MATGWNRVGFLSVWRVRRSSQKGAKSQQRRMLLLRPPTVTVRGEAGGRGRWSGAALWGKGGRGRQEGGASGGHNSAAGARPR